MVVNTNGPDQALRLCRLARGGGPGKGGSVALNAVWALIAGAVLLGGAGLAQDRAGVNLETAGQGRGAPGGVAMLALAQDLYGLGLAQKDAGVVLTAARLAAAVELRAVVRVRTSEGAAASEAREAVPPDVAAMLAVARHLAGEDEGMIGQIDAAAADLAFGPMWLAQGAGSVLGPGGVDLWEMPLFGGSFAEIAVLGDGGANLDVGVTDENGNMVCLDVGATDRLFCDFVPSWNGSFRVRVENVGGADNNYLLLTN